MRAGVNTWSASQKTSQRFGSYPFWGVVQRNWLLFKQGLGLQLMSLVAEPLMYFLILGYGLEVNSVKLHGNSYADFLFPGILCLATFLASFQESSFMAWNRMIGGESYTIMRLTTLVNADIALGEFFWSTLKGFSAGFITMVCGSLLGLMHSWFALSAIFIVLLTSCLAAAGGMLSITYTRSHYRQSWMYSLVVIPIILISETVVPFNVTLDGLELIIWLSPIYHLVNVLRGLWLADLEWLLSYHAIIGLLMCSVLVPFALRRYTALLDIYGNMNDRKLKKN